MHGYIELPRDDRVFLIRRASRAGEANVRASAIEAQQVLEIDRHMQQQFAIELHLERPHVPRVATLRAREHRGNAGGDAQRPSVVSSRAAVTTTSNTATAAAAARVEALLVRDDRLVVLTVCDVGKVVREPKRARRVARRAIVLAA